MRVLHVTSECAPWCKTGGLADVSAALPAALREIGIDARVVMPVYASMTAPACHPLSGFTARGKLPPARLLEARLPNGVPAMLVDCPQLYARPGGPYQDEAGADWDDNALRFAQLARVAAAIGTGDAAPWRADLVHCHDWQAALAAAYLRFGGGERARCVTTIHNLAFQGLFAPSVVADVGLPHQAYGVDGLEFHGRCSFLKAGLVWSDAITTVSPTYAAEIQREESGMGLHGLLAHRRDVLHGILNGIDERAWNPATDRLIPVVYTRETLEQKSQNKRALRERFSLEQSEALLAGMVCRLTDQKGVDLLLAAMPALLARPMQLVVLGRGDAKYEQALLALALAHPGRIAVSLDFDESLAHLIEAGADAFLMPSRFEPCGMNQMYSQRYGTVPLVRATGGLADTVTDAGLPGGTGFVFRDADPAALVAALERMLEAWSSRARWRALQENGMARDFGWTSSARAYASLYERVCATATT